MNILSHLAFPSWLQRIFCCPLEHWPMQEKHSQRIKHSLLLMRSELTTCRLCKWFNGYLTDSAWYSALRNNMFKHKRELCRLHTLDCDDEFSPDSRSLTSHHFYHGISSCSSFSPCLEFLVSLEQLKLCSEYTYYIYRLLHSRQFLLPTDSPKSS